VTPARDDVRVVRTYERRRLRADLVAGMVLAAILAPRRMAYAELAGLPAATGLYTTIACLLAYAVFGPSRVLVLGSDSSGSPLILAAIVPVLAGGDAATAIALAGMLALFVGLIEIGIDAASIAAGFFQGLAVSTSGSRPAVAEQSGAKGQVTGLVGAGLVAVLLLFLNGLLADLPQSTLAAVVIVAAMSLMDCGILRRYWRVRRSAPALPSWPPRVSCCSACCGASA
jgi:MFS superfamily sulfate permease-like transporter